MATPPPRFSFQIRLSGVQRHGRLPLQSLFDIQAFQKILPEGRQCLAGWGASLRTSLLNRDLSLPPPHLLSFPDRPAASCFAAALSLPLTSLSSLSRSSSPSLSSSPAAILVPAVLPSFPPLSPPSPRGSALCPPSPLLALPPGGSQAWGGAEGSRALSFAFVGSWTGSQRLWTPPELSPGGRWVPRGRSAPEDVGGRAGAQQRKGELGNETELLATTA